MEFEINISDKTNRIDDIWGAAFGWNGNKGVEFNYCIEEDGNNCCAIYQTKLNEEGLVETDYSNLVSFNQFSLEDPDWEKKLKGMMKYAYEKIYAECA